MADVPSEEVHEEGTHEEKGRREETEGSPREEAEGGQEARQAGRCEASESAEAARRESRTRQAAPWRRARRSRACQARCEKSTVTRGARQDHARWSTANARAEALARERHRVLHARRAAVTDRNADER